MLRSDWLGIVLLGLDTQERKSVRPEKFQFLEKGQNRNFG